MKIAIIGAGNVGTALATSLGRAGHEVIITDRDRGEAEQAASATGARVAGSNAEAAAEADVVIPAVGMNQKGSSERRHAKERRPYGCQRWFSPKSELPS